MNTKTKIPRESVAKSEDMRVILVGYGVVGQSFTQLIQARRQELLRRYGLNPRLVTIIDRGGYTTEPKGLDLEKTLKRKSETGTVSSDENRAVSESAKLDLLDQVDAEVVVEALPTNIATGEPGLSYIERAIKTRKHVITTDKGPLALALPALMELAEYNGVQLRFSGTVGGGTPILEFGRRCLSSDRVLAVEGILNGTTNFILTRMEREKRTFDEALKMAQKLGYAEADPSLDVDGVDTAAKITIMANWLLGMRVTIKDVDVGGIRSVTPEQIRAASRGGRSVKLIGSADGGLKVGPKEVSRKDPVCVDDTLNAVKFVTEYAGEEVIIGKGAGGVETASAILRDLLSIKEAIATG